MRMLILKTIMQFQYILCYGSTAYEFYAWIFGIDFNTSYVTVQLITKFILDIQKNNFNTSYVTVQHKMTDGIYLHIRISIHPMLRFNWKK